LVDIPEHIKNLKAYVPGKPIDELAREKNLERVVKLASNENPLGPSPKAIEALANALRASHRYVDPSSHNLVRAIAKKYDKKPEQIICGHGIDAILAYIINAFTNESDEILTSEGTFIGIYVNAMKFGRKVVRIPQKEFGFDLKAVADAITENTKLIYLANPNNPTGTMFNRSQFETFMSKVPESIPVILDEAYTAFAEEHDGYPDGFNFDFKNLIVTRTFSKAYGLAGLRVGFAVANPELIKVLYKVKLPFEPNLAAQAAAIAALDDDEFLTRTKEMNSVSLNLFRNFFDELGIKQVPTTTNFILLLFPTDDFASAFNEECQNNGLIVRYVKPFGISNGIRINSGTEDETDFAINVIRKVYAQLKMRFDKATPEEKIVRS